MKTSLGLFYIQFLPIDPIHLNLLDPLSETVETQHIKLKVLKNVTPLLHRSHHEAEAPGGGEDVQGADRELLQGAGVSDDSRQRCASQVEPLLRPRGGGGCADTLHLIHTTPPCRNLCLLSFALVFMFFFDCLKFCSVYICGCCTKRNEKKPF